MLKRNSTDEKEEKDSISKSDMCEITFNENSIEVEGVSGKFKIIVGSSYSYHLFTLNSINKCWFVFDD